MMLTLIACSTPSQQGKNKMSTQSQMLNEIFAYRSYIEPDKLVNVNHIVTKYIPIGTSKEEVKNILNKMNQKFKEEEDTNVIQAGTLLPFIPMVPRGGVMVELKFNQLNSLEEINSEMYYQQ